MSPLQRIGLGLILVVVPADFPAHPHPVWNYYDALPPPVGWLLVLTGVVRLIQTTDLDLALTRTATVVALAVSVPMWFPQVNHYVVPQYNPGVSQSWQWLVALPAWAFGYFLSKAIGDGAVRREPPERSIAGWFGILRWGFVAAALLPAIVYGAKVTGADHTMHLVIGLVEICLIVAMFTYHRREWLGGPGPKVWVTPDQRAEERAASGPTEQLNWQEFKAERERLRQEMRERRRARREEAKRPR
ncbi:MAG: hypothetical protein ACTHOG_06925 [Marmoricola sp.]